MRLVILTLQISPYHNARYVGASRLFPDLHVVSTMNSGDFSEFITDDVGTYSVHRLYEGRQCYTAAAASGDLARHVHNVLLALRPDAIAAAGWGAPESLTALAYGREHGVPAVVMSESQDDDGIRLVTREALKRRVVSQFDAALVGGPPHAEYVERLGIHPDRIHYGYNAVNNQHFREGAEVARADAASVRRQCGLPQRYILASGRFIAKKNFPALIAAYVLSRRRVTDAPDLVVLGDGPERSAIEAVIAAAGVGEHVHLMGFRSYRELPAFYGLSVGFAHVSRTEQWGLVINEAMAAALPVIASRRCGAARTVIVDGVSGILTDPDVPAIADALTKLFHMTANEAAIMGGAAAAAIAEWGPHRFGAGMEAAIESAFRAPRRGSLAIWDRIIFAQLQRRVIEAVA